MAEEIRLSKSFIETELPQAPPLYVSVYLMTLAVGQDAKKVAERLKATETDVLYAWGYWKGKGYLQEEKKQETERPALVSSVRPDYSPRELALYIKNDKVRKLFDSAQKKLGKMLSQQDMSLLFSFYDWLGLPMEVIELLLSYCTASGHTGMRYIEKVAIGWAEEGVNTVEKAAEYIELRKTGYRSILQAFGQNRMPVAAEEAYMKKWLQEYKLPLDVVKLACERTVMQTGKASFAYADRILENWKKAGVSSVADVQAQDAAFAAKKAQNTPTAQTAEKPQRAQKQNRFIIIRRANGILRSWRDWNGNREKNGKNRLGGEDWQRKHRFTRKSCGNMMPCGRVRRRSCENGRKACMRAFRVWQK